MRLFETHAHYNDEVFKKEELDDILNNCRSVGVDTFVNVGYNKTASIDSIKLSNKYNDFYAAIGVHPHDVDKDTAQDIYDVYNKYDSQKVVAIGEIGLDYVFVKDNKESQKKLFEEQIELSNTLKLPIVIHTRDASLDTYNILKEKSSEYGTLLHCFKPTDDLMKLVLNKGFYVAFGGNITYKRNASFAEYITKIPLSQIVLETDTPYLSPEPYRGTRNDSSRLPIVLNKLSEFLKKDKEELAEIVYDNSVRFYRIDKYI